MKEGDEMPSTLEDFIRQHAAPNALFSENAKSQVEHAVHDILPMYAIEDFQCEPYLISIKILLNNVSRKLKTLVIN